ncbi:MAG TPA: hypothetical protein VG797_07375 [Phycisphaerales bacterium]|nr:hypothetical protein [Phycisphaerales bacterium]
MTSSLRHLLVITSATTALAASGLLSGGCASYANYPEIGEDAAINDPNHPPIPELMAATLKYTVEKYPIGGDYVVNLPPGMQLRWAERVVKRIEDPAAHLVTPGTEALPAYHITEIWLRGDAATVEVIRPVRGLKPGAEGQTGAYTYQSMRLKLRGTLGSDWRVIGTRAWTMGAAEPPRLYGWASETGASKGQ